MSTINLTLAKRSFVGIKTRACGLGGFTVNTETFGWTATNVVLSGLVGTRTAVCR